MPFPVFPKALFPEILHYLLIATIAVNGIDIVLKHATSAGASSTAGVVNQHTSAILFTSPQLEITDAVIKARNDAWGLAAIEEN